MKTLLPLLGLLLLARPLGATYLYFQEDPAKTAPVTVTTDLLLEFYIGDPAEERGFFGYLNTSPTGAHLYAAACSLNGGIPLEPWDDMQTRNIGLMKAGSSTEVSALVEITSFPLIARGGLIWQPLDIWFSTENFATSGGGGPEEDGTLQDLTPWMGLPEGWSLKVQSIPDPVSAAVPESPALLLLGLGLAGWLGLRRRTQLNCGSA